MSQEKEVDSLGPLENFIDTEKWLTFRTDNGLFWCSLDVGGEFSSIQGVRRFNESCKFKVLRGKNGKILLQDWRGVYLSRIQRVNEHFIEAAKSEPDALCEFQVSCEDEKVIFRADNGKVVSRYFNYTEHNIEAAPEEPNYFCRFTVSTGEASGDCWSPIDCYDELEDSENFRTPEDSQTSLERYIDSDQWATFRTIEGTFWCSKVHSGGIYRLQAVDTYDEEWCKFKVSKANNGKILLQDKRGVYLSLHGSDGIGEIQATKRELDTSCEFQVSYEGRMILFKAENDRMLSLFYRCGGHPIKADKDVSDVFCKLTVSSEAPLAAIGSLEKYINKDKWVTFTTDNGLFWCSKPDGDICEIQAVDIFDEEWCKFKVSRVNGAILMQDKRGVYLSRIRRGDIDFIEAAKPEPDVFCEFSVSFENEKLLFQAENGRMLSRVCRYGQQIIEAAKDTPDVFCQVTVSEDSLSLLEDYICEEKWVSFATDNGMFWCSTKCGGTYRIKAVDSYDNDWCKFKVTRSKNGKIMLQDKRGVYLSRIRWGDVDFVEAIKPEPDVFCEFQISSVGEKMFFTAENGRILTRMCRYGEQNIEAAKETPDAYCKFLISTGETTLDPLKKYLNAEEWVIFRTDNGMFWRSTCIGSGIYRIKAADAYDDDWCKFRVKATEKGKILLQDKRGMYLSRIQWDGLDFIEAAKSEPDASCEFQSSFEDEKVIFTAENGRMLSRFSRYGEQNIEAVKDTPDTFCKFFVSSGGAF
ncbi:uncharacterized protein LOC114655484 [Erpetoichthys calabaricus]|uniref:uncharacterized protein LOC114655484 n=1 Tax=Erpetoichthys calabaricus TaxID=27687 RepID=UPI002234D8D1|nr:uncharacterized protein LOC114655484 [Erpetoichthys calabaricus]XP_051779413.1 uncharacterized protein LOC114655484 [Erpetoichthys calabaricus]